MARAGLRPAGAGRLTRPAAKTRAGDLARSGRDLQKPRAGARFSAGPLPLALYVHIPWCVRKCPYCDFNSHPRRETLPEDAYVDALLLDLESERAGLETPRPLLSVFIGGGTPSLFSGRAVRRLLRGVGERIGLAPDAEITLEANPGTAEARRFADYREAGVNRLSIGAQSLSDGHLRRIGRIHGAAEVRAAVTQARAAGFDNINLDLMYALPGQDLEAARQDLAEALALAPEHLSYYQLALEPNTAFHAAPPPLPEDDLAADMQQQGIAMLADAGYRRYEVSAYARGPALRCRHNLNYWRFGDYLGIGAGAHGKLTAPSRGDVMRRWKLRHPNAYLAAAGKGPMTAGQRRLEPADLVLEFAMNALRLCDGFDAALFEQRTGLPAAHFDVCVEAAAADGLLDCGPGWILPTVRGRLFLDDLLQYFAAI